MESYATKTACVFTHLKNTLWVVSPCLAVFCFESLTSLQQGEDIEPGKPLKRIDPTGTREQTIEQCYTNVRTLTTCRTHMETRTRNSANASTKRVERNVTNQNRTGSRKAYGNTE